MGEFGDLKTCRRKFLLNYFDEEFKRRLRTLRQLQHDF